MSLLKLANRIPPCLCRLIARKNNGRQGMTNADIVRASGLSLSMVKNYSYRASWKGIPIESIDAFARGCGINLLKMERDLEFIRRRKWVHLERGNAKQRQFYQRLLMIKPQSATIPS